MIPTDQPAAFPPTVANTKPARAAKRSPARQPTTRRPRKRAKAQRAHNTLAVRRGSKAAKILALLKRTGGASLHQLQKATGWQPHSVRGFLSGALNKKMGLHIDSSKPDGERIYRLTSS